MPRSKASQDARTLDQVTAVWELMHRDPLGHELTDLLLQLSAAQLAPPEQDDLIERRLACEAQLCEKYGVPHLYIPEAVLQGGAPRYVEAGVRCWFLPGHEALVAATRDWVPPGTVQFGASGVQTSASHPLPLGQPPVLTLQIDLSKVKQHDLELIASAVKDHVREALQGLPPNAADHSTALPALQFLRSRSKENFYQDLRRYDLHMNYGLSFRLIALLEAQESEGHPLPTTPKRRRVGRSIPGEDGVEKAVKQIAQAIHRRRYRARRRRLDAPAQGSAPFYCPTHGSDCPDMTCPHLQQWWSQVSPSLPTDRSGLGPLLLLQDAHAIQRLRDQHPIE